MYVMFLTIGLLIYIIVFSVEKGGVEKIVAPIPLFSIFFIFVYFVVPVIQNINVVGRTHYFYDSNTDIALSALSISLVYFTVSLVVAYVLGAEGPEKGKISQFASVPDKHSIIMKRICIFFILLGSFFVLKILYSFLSDFSYFFANRISLLSGMGYSIRLLDFGTPALILLLLSAMGGQKRDWFILILVLLIIIGFGLVLGSRSRALFPILFMLGAYFFVTKRRINFIIISNILVVAIALFMIAAYLGQIRSIVMGGGIDDVANVTSTIEQPSAVNELYQSFGNAELLAFLIDHKTRWNYEAGYTYYAGLISFFPRSLWPEKPLGGGPKLANIVAPGVYKLNGTYANSSLTTGAVTEAFLNGGIFMVIIIAAIHGVLLHMLARFGRNIQNSLDLVIYLMTLQFVSMTLINAEFLGAFAGFTFIVLPLFLFNKLRGKKISNVGI